jgi:hypothetical protein
MSIVNCQLSIVNGREMEKERETEKKREIEVYDIVTEKKDIAC